MGTQDTECRWEAACREADLAEGVPRAAKLAGVPVALYKVEGRVYATHDECTHAYALLSDGFLDGHTIECPLHGAMYDVRDGKCLAVAACDLKTYPVKLDGGLVRVQVEPSGDGA
jgi:nitrite reductase/ring-hydroxylating ferredoxin subunit